MQNKLMYRLLECSPFAKAMEFKEASVFDELWVMQ